MAELMTATEFANLETDDDQPRELIAGRVDVLLIPYPYYGFVCGNAGGLLRDHVESRNCGRVLARHCVITKVDPDSVRLADVSYYSFDRVPHERRVPDDRLLDVRPELVFEVPMPQARLSDVLEKVADFLNAGVDAVCVIDMTSHTATVYRNRQSPEHFHEDAELTLPDVLPGFRVPVRQIFE